MSTGVCEIIEKPMLFSSEMVRAILDGRKSQTRRVVKPQPESQFQHMECHRDGTCEVGVSIDSPNHYQIQSPHPVGSRIWVKETFAPTPGAVQDKQNGVIYRADDPEAKWTWKPSIFMPRWASRITLEVTAVRVERLQDISTDDAEAEGALSWVNNRPVPIGQGRPILHPKDAYRALWDSINGKGLWDKNPWVWAYTFKRKET